MNLHRRKYHQQSTTLTFGDGSFTLVKRHPNNKIFTCPCGSYENTDSSSIRKHAKHHPNNPANVQGRISYLLTNIFTLFFMNIVRIKANLHDQIVPCTLSTDIAQEISESLSQEHENRSTNTISHICEATDIGSNLTVNTNQSDIYQILNIHFNHRYRLIICKSCEYGIFPSTFKQHIRRFHQITRYPTTELDIFCNSLNLISTSEMEEISTPIPAIPYLKIHSGFICQSLDCGYSVGNEKWMRRHQCIGRHSGEPVRYRPAKLQRFFNINASPYFEVYTPDISSNSTPSTQISTDIQRDVHIAIQEYTQMEDSWYQRDLTTGSNLGEKDISPWLKQTKFPEYLADICRSDICKISFLPNFQYQRASKAEMFLAQSADRFFDRIKGATQGISANILEWANSEHCSEPDTLPFAPVGDRSWAIYCRHWKRVFLYLYRLAAMPEFIPTRSRDQLAKLINICLKSDSKLSDCLQEWRHSIEVESDMEEGDKIFDRYLTLMMAMIQQE